MPHRATVATLATFLTGTGVEGPSPEPFCNENPRTVRIDIDGSVWIRPGAAVAYRGDLHFERLATLEAGSFGDALVRETAPLVRASGRGRLYCGHHGAHAHVVRLEDEGLVVTWAALLAFESTLDRASALVGHGVGLAAGGLVGVTLTGSGAFALAAHGEPVTLAVSPGEPLNTDPHATLAWSPSLTPRLKTDLSWRSAFGHGGSEPVQMHFEGQGYVLVQPFEQPAAIDLRPHPIKRVAKLVTG
jgi:uncharacterized protein (AIM24 family)